MYVVNVSMCVKMLKMVGRNQENAPLVFTPLLLILSLILNIQPMTSFQNVIKLFFQILILIEQP